MDTPKLAVVGMILAFVAVVILGGLLMDWSLAVRLVIIIGMFLAAIGSLIWVGKLIFDSMVSSYRIYLYKKNKNKFSEPENSGYQLNATTAKHV